MVAQCGYAYHRMKSFRTIKWLKKKKPMSLVQGLAKTWEPLIKKRNSRHCSHSSSSRDKQVAFWCADNYLQIYRKILVFHDWEEIFIFVSYFIIANNFRGFLVVTPGIVPWVDEWDLYLKIILSGLYRWDIWETHN